MSAADFATLNLAVTATLTEVKKAFRKQALKTHPDKHPEPSKKSYWTEKFKSLTASYDRLCTALDPSNKNRTYNTSTSASSQPASSSSQRPKYTPPRPPKHKHEYHNYDDFDDADDYC